MVKSVEGAFVFTAMVSRRALGSTPTLNVGKCPPCGGVATSSVFWLRPHTGKVV